MSKISALDAGLKYPEKEKAYAVIPENNCPFLRATVGITNPYPDYNIFRQAGNKVNNFEYVLEGEGEVFLDGEWKKVCAGDVFILFGGDEHRYRARPENPWKKIWINYRADYIESFMTAYGLKSGIYRCEGAKNYFEAVFEAVMFGNAKGDLTKTIANTVHKIISLVSDTIFDDGESAQSLIAPRIRREISNSLYTKLDLSALAEKFYMSKSNVIRVFKKNYGVTPYEYLLSIKIEAAKSLLLGTQMTVKEIADRLSISDEHYFSTLFYKRVGLRPVDFRNK